MSWQQWLILITGPTAIFFSQSGNIELNKWACILGLIGQVGWFCSTFKAKQWGAFISCFVYTYAWCLGLVHYWFQ